MGSSIEPCWVCFSFGVGILVFIVLVIVLVIFLEHRRRNK